MQIIIPMSGLGTRFLQAGYKVPKPLIEFGGKTIIEYVVNLFPGEENFIFICNKTHLNETNLRETLNRIAPSGKIIEIETHKKGPVYAVSKAFDLLKDDEEVVVNYCDFSKYWDHRDFLKHTRDRSADGAISAYRNFHPHMLWDTNYAFIRDNKQWLIEVKEKQPFTNNRIQEFASDGTYYFRKGSCVKKYFQELMDRDISINGEYYVSMVYNLMKEDGLNISIYEIQHMLQLGAPSDLRECERWSDYFSAVATAKKEIEAESNGINLIPLAGRGVRFINGGYKVPKPLINISGKSMFIQAASCIPKAGKYIFVCLGAHLDNYPLEKEIRLFSKDAKIVRIDAVTQGQACTCEKGLFGEDLDLPLLIGASDNGMLWNKDKYQVLLNDQSIDCILWSFRRHPSIRKNPQMYGWIKVDEKDNVTGVSVKKPISEDPYNDHAITGTFYFRKGLFFIKALNWMYKKDVRINGEFYVDSCINELIEMGLKVKVFEVDSYIGWGTPDDLRSYEYWQSFFHKSSWHPYALDKDAAVNREKITELESKYRFFKQEYSN